MKLNMMARFRETIPTVKSISSSEIEKNYGFLPKLPFYPFQKIGIFSGLTVFPSSVKMDFNIHLILNLLKYVNLVW